MRRGGRHARIRVGVNGIVGMPVVGFDGSRLGRVVDVHVGMRTGTVVRVVVAFDHEGQQRTGTIPWSLVRATRDGLNTVVSLGYLLGRQPEIETGITITADQFMRPTL